MRGTTCRIEKQKTVFGYGQAFRVLGKKGLEFKGLVFRGVGTPERIPTP